MVGSDSIHDTVHQRQVVHVVDDLLEAGEGVENRDHGGRRADVLGVLGVKTLRDFIGVVFVIVPKVFGGGDIGGDEGLTMVREKELGVHFLVDNFAGEVRKFEGVLGHLLSYYKGALEAAGEFAIFDEEALPDEITNFEGEKLAAMVGETGMALLVGLGSDADLGKGVFRFSAVCWAYSS